MALPGSDDNMLVYPPRNEMREGFAAAQPFPMLYFGKNVHCREVRKAYAQLRHDMKMGETTRADLQALQPERFALLEMCIHAYLYEALPIAMLVDYYKLCQASEAKKRKTIIEIIDAYAVTELVGSLSWIWESDELMQAMYQYGRLQTE